jgi:septal ring factor EnvC (AmiA/AmiB activator)
MTAQLTSSIPASLPSSPPSSLPSSLLSTLRLRRLGVAAGVVATLLVGAAAIGASAEWTRANAPLTETPIAPAAIEAGLATQQDRAAALTDDVAAMAARTAQLRDAITAADEQVGAASANTDQIRTELAAATAKLATLQAQIAQARARLAAMRAPTVRPPAAIPARGGGEVDDGN